MYLTNQSRHFILINKCKYVTKVNSDRLGAITINTDACKTLRSHDQENRYKHICVALWHNLVPGSDLRVMLNLSHYFIYFFLFFVFFLFIYFFNKIGKWVENNSVGKNLRMTRCFHKHLDIKSCMHVVLL